jgi:hypothetical protein
MHRTNDGKELAGSQTGQGGACETSTRWILPGSLASPLLQVRGQRGPLHSGEYARRILPVHQVFPCRRSILGTDVSGACRSWSGGTMCMLTKRVTTLPR